MSDDRNDATGSDARGETRAVVLEQHGEVAEIVLCAPPLNLFGAGFAGELRDVVDRLRASEPRAALIRAEGKHFSAGADVTTFQDRGLEDGQAWVSDVVGLFGEIATLPFPVIAAVQGYCLGGGLELALACDLIVAADDARLGLVESMVGGIPFAGGMQRVSAKVGTSRALEMAFTAQVYDAPTLADWGLINRLAPGPDLLDAARELANELAQGPTIAHAAAKRIVQAWLTGGADAAAQQTITDGAQVMASRDLQDAVASFVTHGPGKARFRNR